MLGGMGDDHQPSDAVTGDHEHEDPTVAGEAADLLDALRAALDPPGQLDIKDKQAAHRLERAAQLARQRAQREQGEQ
jgi:hypothetical protein